MPKISAVVTGVGLPMMADCLESMKPWSDEVVVVIDAVGRNLSPELKEVSYGQFGVELKQRFPEIVLRFNMNFDNWQITNQTINIGIRAASNHWVAIVHEDTTWPDFDYWGELGHCIERLETLGDKIAGVTFPVWQETDVEKGKERIPPEWQGDHFGAGFLPTSTVFRKSLWEAFGGFDEQEGIWYDPQIYAEAIIRGMTFFHRSSIPPIHHWPSKSYRASDWGDHWTKLPNWDHYGVAYNQRYQASVTEGERNLFQPPEGWKI